MRLTFLLLLLLAHLQVLSQSGPQVTFTKIPATLQLFPRNSSNAGTVPVTGNISSLGYTRMSLCIFRNNIRWKYLAYDLYYRKGAASFYFYPQINAELAEYRFEVYAGTDSDSSLVAVRDSITCGDVYMINGQSNSHPSSSLETSQNEYCRTFGIQTSNSNYDPYPLQDTVWYLASGHYPALTSVWGMQLQKMIVEKYRIPVCIINGGTGGSAIEEHMKNTSDTAFYSNTIYGKLLYRTTKAGVNNTIKAIFWYQGEANSTNIFAYYEDYFNRLYNDWKTDYPTVQKIYLFQINLGCTSNSNSGQFREGQRNFAHSYPDIEAIATAGLPGYDGCHYDTSGYHELARQVFRMVARDFYNSPDTANVSSPDALRAYYTSTTRKEIIVEFARSSDLVWMDDVGGKSLRSYFYLDGVSGLVASGMAGGNSIRLKLSDASNAARLSYLPNAVTGGEIFSGPCVRNARGVNALSFFELPIEPPPLIGNVAGCPGAFGPVKHIYGTNRKGQGGTVINFNTTWHKDTIYILHKYVTVTSGATLTIEPGTIIMGAPVPADTTFLIINKGSLINAAGTSSLPIVFTSCKIQGTRASGDWGGIILCGDAPNNAGANLPLYGITGISHGGNNAADASGTMKYVRIEYAGLDLQQGIPVSALTLASAGARTTFTNIQVSYSGNDSYEWLGGTVCGRQLISWKPLDDDFDTNYGYSGYNQFGLGFRDSDIAHFSGSSGIESVNTPGGASSLPITKATFSNFELWGPVKTSSTPYNNFYRSGAYLGNNTSVRIYNTLFIGWPVDSSKQQSPGIFFSGASTVKNAHTDSLRIRNCVTAAYSPDKRTFSDQPSFSWMPYNNANEWYMNTSFRNSTRGNVLLDQKKAPFKAIPLFILSSTSVPIASGSSFQTGGPYPLPVKSYPDGFQSVNYRGAFGGTDWTASWTEFSPQHMVYTAGQPARIAAEDVVPELTGEGAAVNTSGLHIYPNPASNGNTNIGFIADKENDGVLLLYDMYGRSVMQSAIRINKGNNLFTIDLSLLDKGIYLVRVVSDGKVRMDKITVE